MKSIASSIQPNFAAASTRHCSRETVRHHGSVEPAAAAASVDSRFMWPATLTPRTRLKQSKDDPRSLAVAACADRGVRCSRVPPVIVSRPRLGTSTRGGFDAFLAQARRDRRGRGISRARSGTVVRGGSQDGQRTGVQRETAHGGAAAELDHERRQRLQSTLFAARAAESRQRQGPQSAVAHEHGLGRVPEQFRTKRRSCTTKARCT
jgi:hypothetical protein